MDHDIDEILLHQDAIRSRVAQLAEAISGLYRDGELVIVPVLTGSIIFVADLVRQMPMKMRLHVMAVSSYPGPATESQGPRILYPLTLDLNGRHVLVVDDILDTGRTLSLARTVLTDAGAASVRTCVLLRKAVAARNGLNADFVGFDILDKFVVGYGLDYDHYYRNLPDIVTLKPSV